MPETTVGLLHPGEMGSALGAALRKRAHAVVWASEGRSEATAARARAADLDDVGTADDVARRSDVLLSVCPPHAAADVARSVTGFAGIYVDANAIAPGTTHAIAEMFEQFVDGGVIGPPPLSRGTTRLYLSGPQAPRVADLFTGTTVDARILSDAIGDASALKMAYASWTKGTAALLLAVRGVASALGIAEPLLAEWAESLPELPDQSVRAAESAAAKGWRWVGEMEEIAATFRAAGLPDGFHLAAAEIFHRKT